MIASFTLDPGGVLAWIIVGLIAGALASRVVAGRGMGCVADLAVGVAGAFLGGIIFRLFGVVGVAGFWESIVVAFVGAAVLLAILQALAGRRF
ncbi:MAG TPA: GlsB/YeaQ/YmgE family stress response membrane protein [Candidatus Dormibacteraeota bacterium]